MCCSIASGQPESLLNGSLFRSIRGIRSKLELVSTENALGALVSFIQAEELSNAALKAVAQAAANTDGQKAAACSELVCLTISEVPGLLAAVVTRMKEDVDAVRLVNNLAANSELSAARFVQAPGGVEALKVASKEFQLHAFGVINHLSRCPVAAEALVKAGFVDDVLLPVLSEAASSQSREQEATLARGTLALANLTGLSGECSVPVDAHVLGTITKVLDHAVNGIRLATITWLPPSVLHGLCHMTKNPKVSKVLFDTGIGPVFAKILNTWTEETGQRTLNLCMACIGNMSIQHEVVQSLWEHGIVKALQVVTRGKRGESEEIQARAGKLVELVLKRHVAVCMGGHRRLGGESHLHSLDDALMYSIVQFAFGGVQTFDVDIGIECITG